MIFPPCQPSFPGHCTVCKTYNCKTNIFFHCPSQPHGPSGRPALEAKPFYFSTPTASIPQSEVFHFHQRDRRKKQREQPVLSSSGQMTEPQATHSLPEPQQDTAFSPYQRGTCPENRWLASFPPQLPDQMNVCTRFSQNQVRLGVKEAWLP